MNDTVAPRTGAQHASVTIASGNDAFAGMFQDVEGLVPGTSATFSGWHMTPSNPLDAGVEIRIEWRNAAGDVEIARTPNMTTAPAGDVYELFTLTDTVPAGADLARVVYAIQTFGPEATNTGTIHLDDMSFTGTQVPEPGSLSLAGLAGAALLAFRRRR